MRQRFADISVTGLCRARNLPRRSCYRYFGDMEDVLDPLLNHTVQDRAITSTALTIPALEEFYKFRAMLPKKSLSEKK